MNKKLITLVLAGLFSTAAFAAEPNQLGAWTITGNQLIPVSTFATTVAPDADGVAIANALVKIYRAHGFLSVEATVDPTTHTVHVIEAQARPTGPYAAFIRPGDSVLTSAVLELAAVRMSDASKLNGEHVNIEVLPIDPVTGVAEIRTSATPLVDSKAYGASLGISTMGQRYSGPDVATAYGWINFGSGQSADVSLVHGLSNLSRDSKGGSYNSGTAGYKKASAYGLTAASLSFTDYKTGGSYAPLDLTGKVGRASIEQDYLVTADLTAIARLTYTSNKQTLGAAGWTDQQSYAAVFGGARYQASTFVIDAGVEHGLAGSTKFNATPLLGTFDSKYTTLIVNASSTFGLGAGWSTTGRAGFQVGTKGTPSSSQFAIGGPDHGRSYNTGYTATPTGAYASATVTAPVMYGVQAYAGIDGSKGKPVVGADRVAASAFLGARFVLGKSVTGDVSIAKTLGRNDDISAKATKINLVLSASF